MTDRDKFYKLCHSIAQKLFDEEGKQNAMLARIVVLPKKYLTKFAQTAVQPRLHTAGVGIAIKLGQAPYNLSPGETAAVLANGLVTGITTRFLSASPVTPERLTELGAELGAVAQFVADASATLLEIAEEERAPASRQA